MIETRHWERNARLIFKYVVVAFFVPIASSFSPATPTHISPSFSCLNAVEASSSNKQGPHDVIDQSTLTLLEHIQFDVPDHEHTLDFYLKLLGCGLDPRTAVNLMDNEEIFVEEELIWPNCGASQFHLVKGKTAQVLPGHIGLRYKSLKGLKERLVAMDSTESYKKCFTSCKITKDSTGKEFIKIQDRYGNIFHCREGPEKGTELRQPILSSSQTEAFGDIAIKYGMKESECRGIDYIELNCPIGTSAKIASFYDAVFDATTSVVENSGQSVALVAFGAVDNNGRASQYLIFRESSSEIPEYNGLHMAVYVGQSQRDFEQAFRNAEMAGIIWVNPRFSDKVETLDEARSLLQFRFKDIVDLKSGEPIFYLEHEIRSVEHESWPGKK